MTNAIAALTDQSSMKTAIKAIGNNKKTDRV